ncbi:MAG: GTPase domain-containing protein [Bacillus sp. (in: Bacteria)]|nr:GTPase domain-containing protein [Bacillus sp. (in: firmicutes)]
MRYNIVVVGITGVGKSALINYLYGEKIRESGVGKPVSTRGFHPTELYINNLPVTIYDSWGLEVGKDKEWMEDLNEELAKRGLDKPANEWFHSVFYCISASGARVQDTDREIIRKFVKEKYNVTIIFTKSDTLSEEEGQHLTWALEEFVNLDKIFVCSEAKKRMDGSVTKTFGKEEIEYHTLKGFWDSLILRLPARYETIMEKEINEFVTSVKTVHLANLSWIGINKEEVYQSIYKDCKLFISKILNKQTIDFIQEMANTLENYEIFARELELKKDEFKFKVDDFVVDPYTEDGDFFQALKEALTGKGGTTIKTEMEKLLSKYRAKLILEQRYKRDEIKRVLTQMRDSSLKSEG